MNTITVLFDRSKGTIAPEIYGHFSEHIGGVFYDGLWVGEDSEVENIRGFRKALVESFKKIAPPVLRWPGGCFAETYDWRDGIGPRDQRPERVNWWYNRDHRTESNQVGTHEFIDFCRMVGAQPYFAANLTTVPALHIRNWMEYCNMPEGLTTLARERAQNGDPEPFNIKYWGIGNENWGGGGRMTPEMLAREYMRFQTVCESLPGDVTYVACGPNAHDIPWTRRMFAEMKEKDVLPGALSVHYYCGTAGTPQEFTEDQWYELLHSANYMTNVIEDTRAAMDEYDPERRVPMFVDEWGCWHQDGTGPSNGYNLFEQQSNMRDAVVAAMTLNIFNNHCDIVGMANVAQLCNNLHSLYLAHGENFVETPNYFVFDMFKTHQGGKLLDTVSNCGTIAGPEHPERHYGPLDKVSVSASVNSMGTVTVTMANTSMTDAEIVSIAGLGEKLTGDAELTILSSLDPHTCNTFENPRAVVPEVRTLAFTDGDKVILPPASVASLVIRR